MGKQKRKQAEPEVSNKSLKIHKKSKPGTKPVPKPAAKSPSSFPSPKLAKSATKAAKSPVLPSPKLAMSAPKPAAKSPSLPSPKLAKSAPKTAKSPGVKKSEKKQAAADSEQLVMPDLPTVDNDAQLKQIAEKTREAEKLAESREKEQQSKEGEEKVGSMEVVKVKRSQPSLKLKDSAAKAYLSISGPAEDDKTVKVPSYSYIKNRGIVYISHVPHGFYEKQMRDFFSQFGIITNLRLGRSRKTGRSRGFAFVEFKYEEVAKVVAETMNNYLMFDKILKVDLVTGEKKSRAIFMGKIRPSRPPLLKARMKAKSLHNAEKCPETVEKRQARQQKKLNKLQSRLATAGISYDIKIAEHC